MNFKYFDVYRDEKQILAYNLSFKKCHVGLESSKPNSGPKNNTFWFYEDEKHTKNYAGANFELFDIYRDEKHILAIFFFYQKYVFPFWPLVSQSFMSEMHLYYIIVFYFF